MMGRCNAPLPNQVYSIHRSRSSIHIFLPSLFYLLFLFSSCDALAPLVPPDFVAPLCSSNSSLLPAIIRVEMGNCYAASGDYYECTTDSQLNNFTIAPAASPGLLLLPDYEKNNPDDALTVRLSFLINSSYAAALPPELVYSYYDGVSQTSDDEWVGPQSYHDNALFIWFDRSDVTSAPHGFSGFVETFSLLFTPVVWHINATQPDLQLSQSCSLVIQFQVNCCRSQQTMQLVAQPYWILLLSTVTYFFASYFYVYSMMALERLPIWQKTVAQVKENCCCCLRSRNSRKTSAAIQQPISPSNEQSDSDSLAQSLLEPAADSTAESVRVASSSIEDRTPTSTTDRLMHANAMFLILQFLIVIGNLLYLILRFTVLPSSTTEKSRNYWFVYEYIYQFWTNSTVATLLASSAASHLTLKIQLYETLRLKGELPDPKIDTTCRFCWCGCCCHPCRAAWAHFKVFVALNIPAERLVCRHIVVGILILMTPAIATHVLPMAMFFLPFVLLAFLTMIVSAAILYVVIQSTERKATSAFKTIASRQMKQISDSSQASTAASDSEREAEANLKPAQQQVVVEFPWYSLLLFRVFCTLSVILFVQTLFNYGIFVYDAVTNYDPNVESDWVNQFWIVPISKEFANRNAHIYWQAIENDLYEKFRAVTLLL